MVPKIYLERQRTRRGKKNQSLLLSFDFLRFHVSHFDKVQGNNNRKISQRFYIE